MGGGDHTPQGKLATGCLWFVFAIIAVIFIAGIAQTLFGETS